MNTRILQLALILSLLLLAPLINGANGTSLEGRIVDQDNQPLAAATVSLQVDNKIITQVKSTNDGFFKFNSSISINSDQFTLTVTSIGYKRFQTVLLPETFGQSFLVVMKNDLLELQPITVQPKADIITNHLLLDSEKIESGSRHSLVTTDPISAIRAPQVNRAGSEHSSKLRVNGSNPDYFINDANIGTDPNHYGMFSIIPAPVVQNMKFSAQGTSARFSSPSVIELSTASNFTQHQKGSVNFSVLEATGHYSVGNSKYFLLSSLRKSVLDKIVKQFDVQSDRRTIPPTNFQDIFLSSGLKLSPTCELVLDQYHVRDFLSYNTGSGSSNQNGISTFQHTSENFFGLRLKAANENSIFKSRFQFRQLTEKYFATTPAIKGRRPFSADLSGQVREFDLSLDYTFFGRGNELATGGEIKVTNRRRLDLKQHGWNFLPPDANSNNAYLYQREINILYGEYHGNHPAHNSALYLSYHRNGEKIETETGLRLQSYGELNNSTLLLFRQQFGFQLGSRQLRLSAGTYADSPTGRLLDPYQVIINGQLRNLKPIMTKLASATLTNGHFNIGLFAKQISNLPILTNDFSFYSVDGSVGSEFITVKSNGTQNFTGGNISYENSSLFGDKTQLYTFYGYTHSSQTLDNIAVPYGLDAPHSFFAQASYLLSGKIKLGASLSMRSGYRYTLMREAYQSVDTDRYSDSYYDEHLSQENSSRFSPSASLNLFADINWDYTNLYFSVMNLTNRSNPIVNAADGYIYDAGIMPSLGVSYKF